MSFELRELVEQVLEQHPDRSQDDIVWALRDVVTRAVQLGIIVIAVEDGVFVVHAGDPFNELPLTGMEEH